MMLLAIYAVLGWLYFAAGAAVSNHTIDDTSPIVQYNHIGPNGDLGIWVSCPSDDPVGAGVSCRVAGQNVPVFDFTKLKNGTMTVFWGTITIPFTGAPVYSPVSEQRAYLSRRPLGLRVFRQPGRRQLRYIAGRC